MLNRKITDQRYQIDALDGLRGFAALIVVLSHTSNESMHLVPFLDFRGTGKSGVFLFFLLSSFLLSIPLLAKGGKTFTLPFMANYWSRRFLRVYPLYILYLLAALLSTWIMARFLDMADLGVPFMLRVDEFFKHLGLVQGKGVTWSVAVEFKFYFILPLLALAFHWTMKRGLGAATALFSAFLLACDWLWPASEALKNDIRLTPYLAVFISGIYLAVLQHHIRSEGPHTKLILRLIRWLTPAAILGLLYLTPGSHEFILRHHVDHDHFHREFHLYAACWAVVMMAAINSEGWIARIFRLRALRSVGALSFSLYLFHMPLVSAMKRVEFPAIVEGWTVMIFSLIASYLSFRLIEGPISRIRLKPDASGRLKFKKS